MAKRGIQGVMMRATQARDHTATVLSTEEITPSFIRVHLHSDTFFEDAEPAPTAWLRGWFPDHAGKETEHQRGYTISSGNADTGRFSLDFVLHETAGPASAWAQNCRPGDTLQVNTLGSSKFELPEERPAGYLLVGDAAAIPGLAGIISALPQEVPIELYLEEHHPHDKLIPIPSHPRLRTHWIARTGPRSLAQAIEARDWSNWYVWATPRAPRSSSCALACATSSASRAARSTPRPTGSRARRWASSAGERAVEAPRLPAFRRTHGPRRIRLALRQAQRAKP